MSVKSQDVPVVEYPENREENKIAECMRTLEQSMGNLQDLRIDLQGRMDALDEMISMLHGLFRSIEERRGPQFSSDKGGDGQ